MTEHRSLIECYFDSLSVRECRHLLELLVATFVYRSHDVKEDNKYSGRQAQKDIALLLANTDADWAVRELILNMGRALYYSTNDRHPYYLDGLIDLFNKIGREFNCADEAKEFENAIRAYNSLLKQDMSHIVFGDGSVMEAEKRLLDAASPLVKKALDERGDSYFSKSEKRLVRGVVRPNLARRLSD